VILIEILSTTYQRNIKQDIRMNTKILSTAWFKQGFVLLAMSVAMTGCGGGGHSSAPPALPVITDPTGYYSNTGTMALTSPSVVNITDMQAMITSTRIIMASKAQGYYYDGPITVTGNTITGNLVQFGWPGANNDTATLSATINSDHSITGTITHSDHLADPFTLNYATGRANSTVAAIANTVTNVNWQGTLYNNLIDTLTINLADNTLGAAALTTVTPMTLNSAFMHCTFTGTITPISGTSLYNVNFTATGAQCLYGLGGPYTGLAALRTQTSLNDTLVIAAYYFDTASYAALFGEFQ
jgi:hypothetical protein